MQRARPRLHVSPLRRLVWSGLCLLLLLGVCLPPALHAAPAPAYDPAPREAHTDPPPQVTPLGELLEADGTLRDLQEWEGAIDPAGYRLVSAPNEPPRFAPTAMATDSAWASGFHLPGMNNSVKALLFGGGVLYAGGNFGTAAGVVASRVAMWNPTTNSWNALGSGLANGVDNTINAMAYGDGKLYVGGLFTQAGGMLANRVAMWDPSTSTWSPLISGGSNGVSNNVLALAYGDGKLYVGGFFNNAGPVTASRIAMWDPTTGIWSPLGLGANQGTNGGVNALAYGNGKLYVGGDFTTVGGNSIPANYVAMWDPSTTTWSPLISGGSNGVNNPVRALAFGDNMLYVGGTFTAAGPIAANRVAAWNPTTSTWNVLGDAVNNGVGNSVTTLAYTSGTLYVGGSFATAAGTSLPASNVARWIVATNSWEALGTPENQGTNGTIDALAFGNDTLYVGGAFNRVAGTTIGASRMARWEPATNSWSTLSQSAANGLDNTVKALAYGDGKLYVGGDFTQAGRVAADRIAMWDPVSGSWSALGSGIPGMNRSVLALAYGNGKLYVGGFFNQAGGLTANNIAMWDPATSSWSALVTGGIAGVDGPVHALTYEGNKLYVGGAFATAGNVSANRVAVWNTTSGWSALGSGISGGTFPTVYALAVGGNRLYVGGFFTQAGSTSANNIAAWNISNNSWGALGTNGNNGVNNPVLALAYGEGRLYVGGNFTTAGGIAASAIAMWNPSNWSWNALVSNGNNGVNNMVRALAFGEGRLVVGGDFTTAGGLPASRLARWEPVASSWSSLGSGINSSVHALAIGSLWVGGAFTMAGDKVAHNLAQWVAPVAATLSTFEAQADGLGGIEVAWETASELDNAGFYLWRATSLDGELTRVTPELIPSQVPGSPQGASYRWVDTDVVPGATYFYWLEDVSLDGATTRHGPISATLTAPTALTLSTFEAVPAAAPIATLGAAIFLLLAGALLLRQR